MIIKCPNCGKEYYDDDLNYCEICGMDLKDKPIVNHSKDKNPVDENHSLATALGFIFAFLFPIFGLIFGVYLVTRNDSTKYNVFGVLIIAISIIVFWFILIPVITYIPLFLQYSSL